LFIIVLQQGGDYMKKLLLTLTSVFTVFTFVSNASAAKPDTPKGLQDRGPITKQTFIHYKRNFAKPPWAGGGNKTSDLKCYSFLAKDAYWKSTEDYLVNASGSGMLESEVEATINTSVNTWDSETSFDIFGSGRLNNTATFDFNSYDNSNVLMFGNYDDNVIGVTNVWGYFGGPPSSRELVEWDMLLNTDFIWGNVDDNLLVMDLENIVTHELGHALGLADQYELGCSPVTMYGYSTEGETKNRSLEPDDITGARQMYN